MTSNLMIGFIAGLGLAAWVYSKIYRSSGGNTKNALIVAAAAGFGAMVLLIIVLGIFFKQT